jgi:Nucleoside-diphosphate-sugar epimerases
MRVLVTGGGGFLGSHLVERLEADGADVFVPRRTEYDLTHYSAAERLFAESKPELVFHLAAEVGGIGANQANPGRYWFGNLMMGAHVLEQARLNGTRKLVMLGTICEYPKFTPCRSARTISGTAIPRRRTRRTASPRRPCWSARRRIASSTGRTPSICSR